MEFIDWEPYYLRILEEFGYSREEDERSARLLDEMLGGERVGSRVLTRMLKGREVTVAGNAPSVQQELVARRGILITADEATSVAIQADIMPDILVTDLDGRVEDQIEANAKGTVAVIHAHGDNILAIGRWAPLFKGRVVGTTQSRPFGRIYDFGGFTDGDRAAFLARHFGASSIRLVGFDFEHPSPKDEDVETKKRKLTWARKLLGVIGVA